MLLFIFIRSSEDEETKACILNSPRLIINKLLVKEISKLKMKITLFLNFEEDTP
jgi:hypothetical protein